VFVISFIQKKPIWNWHFINFSP